MRLNLPVTSQEHLYGDHELLVSTTDTRGVITHCNAAFVRASGYGEEELLGQPHNLIRHPDMPAAAFADLWETIRQGRPWTGLVKNRRKNGDHYWVEANVTPILQGGKPRGYLSVRVKPARERVAAAEALYAQMRHEEAADTASIALRGGQVRRRGLRGALARAARLSLIQRLGLALAGTGLLALAPPVAGLQGGAGLAAQALLLAAGLGTALWHFQARFATTLREIDRSASDLSACNLVATVGAQHPPPMDMLARQLKQIQVNLRAVVGDVRSSVDGLGLSAQHIAQGGADLAARTESQASSLQQTVASMEELAGTVRSTADAAAEVARRSEQSTVIAARGSESVRQAGHTMDAIERSSREMQQIVSVIESIAFQTNLLALNAAVEGARLGQQGNGFMVVANEVRALAQRSADAARQIRDLISASVEQIAQGARQMSGAARTIQEVVNAVCQVSELAQQIQRTTQEQSAGISQVNIAIALLDGVTQQNVALVEELAASAQTLRQNSIGMSRSVQLFHMDRD